METGQERSKNGITITPASPADEAMFYTMSQKDSLIKLRIGHERIDFGRSGNEFWYSWFEQPGNGLLNNADFKADIQKVMDYLRGFVLKDRRSMRRYCSEHGTLLEYGINKCHLPRYGFIVETAEYRYYLRCSPSIGDYNAYLNCFKK